MNGKMVSSAISHDAENVATDNAFHSLVRVLRKYPYSKTLMFMDFSFYDHMKSLISFGSIVIRSDDVAILPNIIAGYVLELKGIIQNYEKYGLERTERPSVLVSQPLNDVIIRETWSIKELGFFSFEHEHISPPGKVFLDLYRLDSLLPVVAIQCKHKSCQRMIEILSSKLSSSFSGIGSSSDIQFRQSSTSNIKSNDRLVLIVYNPSSSPSSSSLSVSLIGSLTTDPIISPYIMRIYSGNHPHAICFTCNALLEEGYREIMKKIQEINSSSSLSSSSLSSNPSCTVLPIKRIRLHSFPKYINQQLLDVSLSNDPSIEFSPSHYDYVLSILFSDGLWIFSLMAKEQMFIGDLREKKQTGVSASSASTVETGIIPEPNDISSYSASSGTPLSISPGIITIQDNICRAQAKMEECMQRNQWIYGNGTSDTSSSSLSYSRHRVRYEFAIDIGSSPGGWTSFLCNSCETDLVLSCDKGELAIPEPWSDKLIYWRLHGEDALDQLLQIKRSTFCSKESSSTGEELSLSSLSLTSKVSKENLSLLREKGIDLFCCDANILPFKSLSFFFFCHQNNLLAKKGKFIITLKNIFAKKEEWEICVTDCLKQLKESSFCFNIQCVHLLANTPKETTVSGEYIL
jgi:hypothetical protein